MSTDVLSIVIPVFNNEESISLLVEEISTAVSTILPIVELEIILVDDGSTDDSWLRISELASTLPGVIRAVKLTRNFGQLAAMLAGWQLCKGDAVINMSADLQDPPSVIPSFVNRWREGFEVVVGVRAEREDGIIARLTSRIAHRFLRSSNSSFPQTWFDFTLMSRKNLETVLSMSGRYRFTQGDIFYAGFKYAPVLYTRARRQFGKSGYTFWKRFASFTDSVLDSSYFLIQLFIRVGFLVSVTSLIYAGWIIFARLTGLIPSTGWAPIMIVLLLSSGLIMSMLGIIAEYLWRIYDSTRKKPIYVIESEIKYESK
jgi:glycosyltransferase involved in cell wall biosynthesis